MGGVCLKPKNQYIHNLAIQHNCPIVVEVYRRVSDDDVMNDLLKKKEIE